MSRLDREWIALGFHEDEEKIIPVIRMSGIDGLKKRNLFVPRLTSVSINTKMQACSCVDVVIAMIEGKKVGRFIPIKPQIIEGDSVRDLM